LLRPLLVHCLSRSIATFKVPHGAKLAVQPLSSSLIRVRLDVRTIGEKNIRLCVIELSAMRI